MVVLIGRLVRDPSYSEVETEKGKYHIASFYLAVPRNFNKGVNYIKITTFGKQADFARDYLTKGKRVAPFDIAELREIMSYDEMEAIKDILINFIQSGMEDMFVEVNNKVGTIATQVGQTSQGWNGSVFSLIKNLSETVMVPIAGMIITIVLCYELITMVTQKNNFHEFETFNIFIWVFKAYIAIYLVTNTFNITMAVFDVGQHVVNGAAGVISGSTEIDATTAITNLLDTMEDMEVGELFLLALETMLISMTMKILSVAITVILYGRMIEIYLTCSVAPIPFATMTNKEWGNIGNNYLKGLFALAFQGFFMMVCVGIYLLLDLFQCEFVILPHPNIFFHLLILFRWDMYRAVIMMCKTSCNQGSISFVCFYLFPARRF